MAFSPIDSLIGVGKAMALPLWEAVRDSLNFLNGSISTIAGTDIPNGSFEVDSDSDGQPDNWTKTLYTGGSGAIDTSVPVHGAACYKFTHPGGVGNGGGYIDSDYFPCAAAFAVILKWFMWATTNTNLKCAVDILWYTKAKVYVSTTNLLTTTTPTTTTSQYIKTATPPATACFLKVRLSGGVNDTNPGSAQSAYFDGVTISKEQFHMETTGSWTINASQTYPVPAGMYNLANFAAASGGNTFVEINASGGWRTVFDSSLAVGPMIGCMLWSDGSNVRIRNTSVSNATTVYWQRFHIFGWEG